MKLSVRRFEYGPNYTISRLYINDSPQFECYVLEDVVRPKGVKVFGETAIPSGKYEVVIDFSAHFNKDLPHILSVPNFSGVRIHSGNDDADTEGCLLVGSTWSGGDFIGGSRDAFNKLFPKLLIAFKAKEYITIEIIDTNGEQHA